VAGAHSGSGTSLYFSLDVGLVHFVVLDTMQYLDLGGDIRAKQLAWLQRDLALASAPAQRRRVPWIVVLTHVPMYCSADGQEGVGGSSREDIEPLLLAANVDVYAYGHVHAYEATWPMGPNGTVTQQSYINPTQPVHILTGAGGPPGVPDTFSKPSPFRRASYATWGYGIVTVNATHFTYEHRDNAKDSIVDSFTIVQEGRRHY
jgi:hypothetical protein